MQFCSNIDIFLDEVTVTELLPKVEENVPHVLIELLRGRPDRGKMYLYLYLCLYLYLYLCLYLFCQCFRIPSLIVRPDRGKLMGGRMSLSSVTAEEWPDREEKLWRTFLKENWTFDIKVTHR